MTLIATCPVCVGETHELYAGNLYCPNARDGWGVTIHISAARYSRVAVARIDGGDPGDEDQEVRR